MSLTFTTREVSAGSPNKEIYSEHVVAHTYSYTMSRWPALNSDKCLVLLHEPLAASRDVVLLSCLVIRQRSGAAKYKSCSGVPHSELMKSGPGQERVGHTHWAGCGGSYCTVQALAAKPIRSAENGF